MNHRHLLPNEIDLLLDAEEEAGFGVAPLRAHIRECAECRARLDEAKVVVEALEGLPLFAPSHRFADKVMAQVPVFVPWHVAARDSLLQFAPRSRSARIAVFGGAATVATALSVAMLWVLTQADLVAFTSGVVGTQLRVLLSNAFRAFVTTVFGDQVFVAVQHAGAFGLAAAVGAVILAGGGALFGLRSLALASGRRRS